MRKKYYFAVKTFEGDIITLVSKGKDSQQAKEKLLTSFKENIKEILSVTEYCPSNEIEKMKKEVEEKARKEKEEKEKAEKERIEKEAAEKEKHSLYTVDKVTGIVNVF